MLRQIQLIYISSLKFFQKNIKKIQPSSQISAAKVTESFISKASFGMNSGVPQFLKGREATASKIFITSLYRILAASLKSDIFIISFKLIRHLVLGLCGLYLIHELLL